MTHPSTGLPGKVSIFNFMCLWNDWYSEKSAKGEGLPPLQLSPVCMVGFWSEPTLVFWVSVWCLRFTESLTCQVLYFQACQCKVLWGDKITHDIHFKFSSLLTYLPIRLPFFPLFFASKIKIRCGIANLSKHTSE